MSSRASSAFTQFAKTINRTGEGGRIVIEITLILAINVAFTSHFVEKNVKKYLEDTQRLAAVPAAAAVPSKEGDDSQLQ